jgi:hypothetical protein
MEVCEVFKLFAIPKEGFPHRGIKIEMKGGLKTKKDGIRFCKRSDR